METQKSLCVAIKMSVIIVDKIKRSSRSYSEKKSFTRRQMPLSRRPRKMKKIAKVTIEEMYGSLYIIKKEKPARYAEMETETEREREQKPCVVSRINAHRQIRKWRRIERRIGPALHPPIVLFLL
jgi:hypothetical protein